MLEVVANDEDAIEHGKIMWKKPFFFGHTICTSNISSN
jgi:hypothetical protein